MTSQLSTGNRVKEYNYGSPRSKARSWQDEKEQENKPETCRNSPDMLPYLWTACSNAFFTVDPFIWTKSTVAPNGRTVRMSSMVMEPIDNHTYHSMITRSRDFSSEALNGRRGKVTIFVALIYGCPYGSTVQHTKAHVIPLQLTGKLDVVIDLQKKKTMNLTQS